jgi:hypothetical protein
VPAHVYAAGGRAGLRSALDETLKAFRLHRPQDPTGPTGPT